MTDPLMSQRTNGGGNLSAGLTWPRRVRPHSLSFRPLRSANPGLSPEGNMDVQPFLSPPIQQRSGYVSPLRAVRTLKEYDQEIDNLRKENFGLKLQLYFLENDMEKITNSEERETLKVNVQLRIEAETLKSEMMNKATMLHEAMVALEKLEEKHRLEMQRQREVQLQLEEKVESLKQELDKERMHTPRSSETGSEIYRQAFGIPESFSGKSSPENEMSWGQTKSCYLAELEKLQCTVDEKDKEIKNMRTVIEDLEKKNKVLEEKVRKRNIAIQGLFQVAKKKENSGGTDQPQGSLHKSLVQAIEAAHTGNRENVISNLDDVRKGLSELLSVPGSEVTLGSSEDVGHLKSEISRKDKVIQTLEEQLIEKTKRVRALEGNASRSSGETVKEKPPLPSSAILEQECERLQKAVREKDSFIRELLDERTKMTSEHQKTVQSLVCQLQNQSESGKIKDSDIYGSESLKMLQELICEKDAEINVRKKTIELLNFQLTKCQSELQAAFINCEEKEHKLKELSSRSIDLENQLIELQHEMRTLKATQQNAENLLTRDSFQSKQSDFPQCSSAEPGKPLIDFDDSLRSASVPEKKHATLTEIKELQKSLEESMPTGIGGSENVDCHIQCSSSRNARIDGHGSPPGIPGAQSHFSSPQQQKPTTMQNKEISETIFVKTPRKETIKLSLNVSKRTRDGEKSDDLLDIMENNIEKFERQKLLQRLEDQSVEIAKLGRHATIQADMTSVLAVDKKRLQQEIEEKTSEVQMLTAGCSELEKQVISLQSQLHSAVKRAEELERVVHDNKSKPKSPIPKSSAAVQTDVTFTRYYECNATLSDMESNLTSFGQTDSVNTLKGEICILILMVEEKDKEILQHKQSFNKLKSDLKNMALQCSNTSQLLSGYSEDISTIHHQVSESQEINHHLIEHLQEVARFMESLISNSGEKKLDLSSLTPEAVSSVIKHITESLELSETLCQNLTTCEESKIFDPEGYSRITNESLQYLPSEFLRSDRMSFGTDDFLSSSKKIETEGSELQVVPLQQKVNRTGKRLTWSSVMQHKATMETVAEPLDSDQLTMLGDSCSEEGMCCLNEQRVPDVTFSEVQAIPLNGNCRTVAQSVIQTDARKNYLNCMFEGSSIQLRCNMDQAHMYREVPGRGEDALPLCMRFPPEVVQSLLSFEVFQKHNGAHYCNISSDSDIWSEPDRNLSLQRIGIDLEAPSFHTRSPPKRRRSTRDRQFSDDCSSDSSFSVNGIPKGRSCPRRRKSTGSFSRRDATEPKLDALGESRLLALESSIEDKLAYVQKLSQTIQDDISGLAESVDSTTDQTQALVNINEEIYNLQSTLANAVEEVKILKGTTKESCQLSQDRNLTEELKFYNEEILSKIDDIEQMKEILIKERCARESAEQNLYSCHQELFSVKQKLDEMQAKTVTRHDQRFISQKKSQEFQQEASYIPEVPESAGVPVDVDLLRKSLAQEEERNVVLSKQMNDLFNESKKLKIEFEQLQFQLMSEQQDLEDIRQQLKSEQDMVKQLSKEKNATENKNIDLAADMIHVKASLNELQDQNTALNKQISNLQNENKKLKLKVEMSEVQLRSEREQLETLNEDHMHKQESLNQLQFQLRSEQQNLEDIRQQLKSEQDMVKQLSKEKNATENKNIDLAADMMHVKASLNELQDQNAALNKQVSDLQNENKKLKLKVEMSEVQLHSEREQLETLNEDHMHKQESLNQLAKDKLIAQSEIANLTSEMETLKILLSQKEDQISHLNKQVTDLHNDNRGLKKELEQLEQNLRAEVERLDALRKAQKDLHKQNMDLTTEKGGLEKQLYYSEDRLKLLADEKADLSKQVFEEQRENKDLLDKIGILEEQKAILEKENSKYKTEIHSSGSVCNETKYDLKQTKDKLKKLELKLHQYENELTKVTSSNEHLLSEKESLREELESVTSKLADLHKQNSETKKLLKDKISNYKEIERERSLLVDHIGSLKIKKVDAESSRDKLLSDYDSLSAKVESLERQLKDSDLNLQKNKDEQEHLRQQTTSLQNKIKLKESVVKELEEQHDVLHEQLKDLQHSLNKNEIDLKHLEDENHSLELQILTLQKQLKKASSHLDAKDGEIAHLQEDIFNLEQKVKDKDTTQRRILEEKKASEDQVQHLREEVKKQDSFHKQLKQQSQELEEHISALEQQLQSKELQKRKSEEEIRSLQGKVEEREKSVKKLESSLKKLEHKLSSFQDTNVQLQHKIKLTETARKFSEDQTEIFREELNKLREQMLIKTRKEEPASTDRLSTVIEQLNAKDEYCRALENKVMECQRQILTLQREYDRATTTTPVAHFSETGMASADRMQIPLIPNKVFSELRSSQDYRHHTEIKEQSDRDNLIKGLELDISDLKHQVEVLSRKLDMAENVKRDLEEENLSLWKTLYGSQDEKTDIIKTLEVKSNDLKKQVEDLENKLETSEKLQQDLEEEKNSLWKTLYEKQDEDVDIIQRLEQKNKELKDEMGIFQTKLKDAERSKQNLREEKDSLWKTIHGKKDEKTDIIRNLQLKNNDLKSHIEELQKELNATEKAKCEFEEEKNSLWKTLYGQHDEKADITKMLEGKNNELKLKVEVLEKKLSHCEKAKSDVEEKMNTLWKTLYGSQDEKTEALKMMEEKNNELKNQIAVLEENVNDANAARTEMEEEKNSMWKTLCGSEDEKTDLLQQMEMKNMDLKGEVETLKTQLISLEKAHKETEEEKSSLWKTLYGTEHENSDIIRNLEVKNNELKRQVQILGKKLDASAKVKKDLEDRINSLRVTIYGNQDEKAEAVRNIELKNNDLLAQVEVLKGKVSDLEKDKNEIEEEKASLWKTVCGSEDEKTDLMRRMEQKNNEMSDQIHDLEKKLKASEETLKEVEDEKSSLWKTLYGSAHEQSDIIQKLEQKNQALYAQVEELNKKLSDSEKARGNLEEERNSLWTAVHGSDDEKTHEIESLETKNGDLKGEIESLERRLSTSEKLKNEFEEEKNSLWKNMYGSQDEKAATIKKLNMEISDLKSLTQDLEGKLNMAEKGKTDLEVEKNSLNEKLNKSIEESANMKNQLELKDQELKNQMEILEEKLRVSEELKKAIEEDRNSLYNQLLGDSSGVKLAGMLRETQIYADQVKKLEQELGGKNALVNDTKQKLFAAENSLTTQQSVVERMNREISNYKLQLEKAQTEREWFQNQYIESQREVIRATQSAAVPGGEIREEDMMVVHQENVDLKKQVTDLLSQLDKKDIPLSLPPVRTELFTIQLPTLPDDKVQPALDRKPSIEMKRAELEKLHIEKNYLQKVVTDLKKQMESRPIPPPGTDILPEKIPTEKQGSDFSEDIAKQLAFHGFSDTSLKEEINRLQSERDHFKNLVDKLQANLQLYTSSLRDKGPDTYTEAETVKLRKENADLKSKLVQQHARIKKRESMIKALSSKVVELSQVIKDSKVSDREKLGEVEKQADSVSLLASQIVESSSKTAEKSLSKDIILPDLSLFHFDAEEDSQLLSLLHPSLQQSISGESEACDLDAKGVQKLKFQIEELENQLEDTRMDNYRLQDEISTLLLKFGIQNNQVVCQKCGKSAEIASAEPVAGVKSGPKFSSFRAYLEKDPMFSKEESINKLSECKWKLQNEVLNMQKKLCVSKPSYLENQESFNNHIAKIMSMEYPKIPVRIFSEPLLSITESKDILKNAQHLELLWKNQVLHLERDIKCLQNYRLFLEQFVFGLTKEVAEATKHKPVVLDRGTDVIEQFEIPGADVSDRTVLKPPEQLLGTTSSERQSEAKGVSPTDTGVPSHKSISLQEAQLLKELPTVIPTPKAVTSAVADDRRSIIPAQTSSVPVLGSLPSGTEKPSQAYLKQEAHYIELRDKNKELGKKLEALRSENKRLLAENKTISLECKKCYKSKNRERQLEKQIDDLKHSLKDMASTNRSLQLELEVYHQMFRSDSRDKSTDKHLDGYVKKSYLMRVLGEMKSLNSELERLTQENSMLRKKLAQLQSPAKAVKSRVLLREESSSDKESEGTVTLSRSGSLSSLDSMHRYEVRAKKYEGPSRRYVPEYKHFQQPWDLADSQYDDDDAILFPTTQRREKPDSIQDAIAHRPHFSSPDLGIESDPNHELFLSEQAESDEKSYMKAHPPRQLVSPTKTKARRPTVDTVTAVWESEKTTAETGTTLHATGFLKDYKFLKKEIEESLVFIKVMAARAKECVEYLSRGANPNKNPGYTTLKEILSSLSELNVCQLKAQQLIRSFWVSSMSDAEESYIVNALRQENRELLRTLEAIMEERKTQKAELQLAFERLREAQESKEKMEKAIAKQLTRTKKVLKDAKSNLQGPEQKQGASSFIPQNKNNPSSSKKPSAK